MNNRIIIIFSVGLVLACGTIFATARSGQDETPRPPQRRGTEPPPLPPPPPFSPQHLDRLARDLNLTEMQLSEIKAFLDAERATMETLRRKMEAERRQLDEATTGGRFDEPQVRALASQQAQTFAELIIQHKRIEARIYSLLTEEQRTRFDELKQRRPLPPPRQPPPPPPPSDGPRGM